MGDFQCFQYFNFQISFLKNEKLFQNIGVLFCVYATAIEKTTFPKKATLSKANVMGITKGTYHKDRSLATNSFTF